MKKWQRTWIVLGVILILLVWGSVFLFFSPNTDLSSTSVPTLANLSDREIPPDNEQVESPVLQSGDVIETTSDLEPVDTDETQHDYDSQTTSVPRQSVPDIALPQQTVPNRAILTINPNTNLSTLENYVASFGGTIDSHIESLGSVVISLPDGMITVPDADFITVSEPDYYLTALHTPNDPYFASQWNLDVVNAHYGWDLLPTDASITVAVVDSGVCFDVLELDGRLLMSGWDFVENDDTPQDTYGHGCGVTNVISANMDNAIGIAGVAPHTSILPLRVLDSDGIGSYSQVAEAIVYAVDQGADIINVSLGGTNQSTILNSAVTYAQDNNVMVVAAAGNSGTTQAIYPAAYDAVIAVGSVDTDLQRSSFSNYGAWVDTFAPGRDIPTISLNGDVVYMSGTSLAVPHVVGVAAIEMALGRSLVLDGAIAKVQDGSLTTPIDDGLADICDYALIDSLEVDLQNAIRAYRNSPSADTEADMIMAREDYLGVLTPCYAASGGDVLEFDSGGHIPSTGEPQAQYRLFGTKWGENSPFSPDQPPASRGGVVTYSFMPRNVSVIEDDTTAGSLTLSFSDVELLYGTCDLETEARAVFEEWSQHADIIFQEVDDTAELFNSPGGDLGDIRIGFIPIDGLKKELGHAYFPGPDPVEPDATGVGDILLDAQEVWGCETLYDEQGKIIQLDFGVVLRHEIGHALGLSHQEMSTNAVMNPSYNGNVDMLQVDDISGIQAIYGSASLNAITLNVPIKQTQNVVELSWIIGAAESYQLQITRANDVSYATPIADLELTDALYITNALDAGLYIWRVRGFAADEGWGPWSLVNNDPNATFEITVGSPSLIMPLNGSALRDGEVEFHWTKLADGSSYELQIAERTDFADSYTLFEEPSINDTSTISRKLTRAESLDDGVYYWRVRENNNSISGPWSNIWQFQVDSNVPTPLEPSNPECQPLPDKPDITWCTTNALTLEWSPVDGAVEYEVVFDTAPNFVGILFMDSLFMDSLFMDSLFMDSLFMDSLFMDSLFMDSLFMDSLFMDSLFMDSLFMDSLFMDSLFMDSLFMDSLFMDSLFMDSLFMDSLFMDSLFMDSLFMDSLRSSNVSVPNFTDGYHYWRVRAVREDGSVSPWSESKAFIVDTDRNDIVINEIYPGNLDGVTQNTSGTVDSPAWIEITNASPRVIGSSVDITNWEMIAYNPDGSELLRYTFDPTFDPQLTSDLLVLEPGEFLVLMEANYPADGNILPNTVYLGANTLNWPLNSVSGLDITDADESEDLYSIDPEETFLSLGTDLGISYSLISPDTLNSTIDKTDRLTNDDPTLTPQFLANTTNDTSNDTALSTPTPTMTPSPTATMDSSNSMRSLSVGDDTVSALATEIPTTPAPTPLPSSTPIGDICNSPSMEIPLGECWALFELYYDTNGILWTTSTNWLETDTPCSSPWYGIDCSGGSVISIQLVENNLTGTLPNNFNGLPNLEVLSLPDNQITGSLPSSLFTLSNLRELNLSNNPELTGSIPSSINGLTSLTTLYLEESNLTGSIPDELGQISTLTNLRLYNNALEGIIPTSLVDLPNLVELDIHSNMISGTIPDNIGNLTTLDTLHLQNNALSGDVPSSIQNLIGLSSLDLGYNSLTSPADDVTAFLNTIDPDWANTQTIAPTNIAVSGTTSNSMTFVWDVIPYTADTGYYEVVASTVSGTYTGINATTATKTENSLTLNGLEPDTTYFVAIRTFTDTHSTQQNALTSAWSSEAVFTTASFSCANVTDIPQSECEVLVDLYNSTDGANWTTKTNWLQTTTACGWYGLSCNFAGTNVTGMNLALNNLVGTIPTSIGNLSSLTSLYLSGNNLTGEIPSTLMNLTSLSWLSLSDNQLSGEIPSNIGNLGGLQLLGLSENQFIGSIPDSIGDLSSLFFLYLNANKLSGDIPSSITNIGILGEMNIGYNSLTASDVNVTSFLASSDPDWADTQTIAPSNVSISGTSSTTIEVIWDAIPYTADDGYYEVVASTVSGTYTGISATTIDKSTTSLTLDGLATDTIYFVAVRTFTASHEIFNGIQQNDLTSEWSNEIIVTTSAFSCASVVGIPESECQALEALYNSTDGANWTNNSGWLQTNTPCDDWYGVTCRFDDSTVTSLYLGNNGLSGTLPTEIGELTNLSVLNAWDNSLTGSIPASISNTKLYDLALEQNELTGSIPSSLGELTSLRYLQLWDNNLTGNIPSSLGNLTQLQSLRLYFNNITGTIPSELGNLSNLTTLTLNNNQLTGEIPTDWTNATSLVSLSLSDNQLTGTIPSSLSQVSGTLRALYLNNNRLEGEIPEEIGTLSLLQDLRIQNNQLSGDVPVTIINLSGLNVLDIGYNSLTSSDAGVTTFLNTEDSDWANTQTVAPSNISLTKNSAISADINWDPIPYTGNGGYYEVGLSETPGEPYDFFIYPTDDKTVDTLFISATANQTYYIAVRTYTPAHGSQQNDLTSAWSEEIVLYTGATPICASVTEIPTSECEALGALYSSTDGANWTNNTNWLQTDTPCGNWYGVNCAGGYVSNLDIDSNNLTGTLPDEIGDFTNLRFLYLQGNNLSGEIPATITDLTALENLWLNNNNISGTIPADIDLLANLKQLDMRENALNGSIPTSLGNITGTLEIIKLDNNNLSGEIPASLGQLGQLRILQLYANELTGEIPLELGALSNLEILWLSNNQLTGSIPAELGQLANVTNFRMDRNNLSGTIPTELSGMLSVENMVLNNNNLNGQIPSSLGTLPNLERLVLYYNNLSGTIPPELGDISTLKVLQLFGNNIGGEIPPQLSQLDNLLTLALNGNNLTGSIPPELGQMASLESLRLQTNDLTGNIPPELGDISTLSTLILVNNNITGTIPSSLGSLLNMTNLQLSYNRLSGEIPPSLGDLVNLETLYLQNNALVGEIPPSITNLTAISTTNIGDNGLLSSDTDVLIFLAVEDPDWADTQTVPPTNISVSSTSPTEITVTWTPILFTGRSGYYEVGVSTISGGPYDFITGTTSTKSNTSLVLDGLEPDATYYVAVRTFTEAQGSGNNVQKNDITSLWSAEVATESSPQTAPVYTVNTTDMGDDGICGESHCSLIEAINTSNADGVNSTIELADENYLVTATHNVADGNNGLPKITTNITINGNLANIIRFSDDEFRFFYVSPSGTLIMNDLTLDGGIASAGGLLADDGGAIFNQGYVYVEGVSFTSNSAVSRGGAIFNDGTLDIVRSYFTDNSAANGGVIHNHYNRTTTIDNTVFELNTATNDGGAIGNHSGIVNITGGSFAANSTARFGGAIFSQTLTVGPSEVTVSGTTFGGNQAGSDGGAIMSYIDASLDISNNAYFDRNISGRNGGAIYNAGTMTAVSTTLTGNESTNSGGGIANFDTVDMTDSIITGNNALDTGTGGGIWSGEGTLVTLVNVDLTNNSANNGGAVQNSGTLNISDSLVDGNTANFSGGGLKNGAISTTSNMTITNTTITNNEAGSGDGGGVHNESLGTMTIDGGLIDNNSVDGRGGGLHLVTTTTISGTTISNNTSVNGGGISTLGDLTIFDGDVRGNEATSTHGGGIYSVNGTLSIFGTIIDNNTATGNGGGIHADYINMTGGFLTRNSAAYGGGIIIQVEGTLSGIGVERNTAVNGGGVYLSTADATISGALIINNTVTNGGAGIYNNNGSLTVNGGSSISGNIASNAQGGGIYTVGTTLLDKVTINYNRSTSGGAVYGSGDFTIIGGEMSSNKVTGPGGALAMISGTADITDTLFMTNNASGTNGLGGAILNDDNMTTTLTNITANENYAFSGGAVQNNGDINIINSTIEYNIAQRSGGGIRNGYTVAVEPVNLLSASNLMIYQTGIRNNQVLDSIGSGGGILNWSVGTLNILDSVIESNAGSRRGGGIYTLDSITHITGTTIIGNNAQSGGGIAIMTDASLTLDSAFVTNNNATDGGGIENLGDLTVLNTIESSNFSTNSATEDGGAIYSSGTATISSIIMKNNDADDGGAIWNDGAMTIMSSVIGGDSGEGNLGFTNGGGIYNSTTANLILETVTFSNNNADYGGAIWNDGIAVIKTDSVIGNLEKGNTANRRGGGVWNSGDLSLLDSVLSYNNAHDGGGIWNESGGILTIDSSDVAYNTALAEDGGGIYNFSSTVSIFNSDISNNVITSDFAPIENASGGGIYNTGFGAVMDIVSSTLTYNQSTNIGGAISNRIGDLTITDSTLSFNEAKYGGGIHDSDGNTYLLNTILTDNSAESDGGGVYIADNGYVDFENTQVLSNSASFEGGGLYILLGSIGGSDNLFEFNEATQGAGIRNIDGNAIVSRSIIRNNIGNGILNAGTLEVYESMINDNVATTSGGGIATTNGNVTLNDVTISGNEAPEGAGLYVRSTSGIDTVTVISGTFSNNTASNKGGAIFTRGDVTISDSSIFENNASSGGAGIYNETFFGTGGYLTLNNTLVMDNTAGFMGGGISNWGGEVTLTNSELSQNISTFGTGGGIYQSFDGTLTIEDSLLDANEATNGGGIYNYSGAVTLTRSTIQNSTGNGIVTGSNYFHNSDLIVTDSTISGNIASTPGGGIYSEVGNVVITNSTISGNSAPDGGGLYVISTAEDKTVTISNSTFTGNSTHAGGGGGAIWSKGTLFITDNTTIDGNDATVGGGIYNEPRQGLDGDITVESSTISGNTAQEGAGIYNYGGSVDVQDNSVVQGNIAVSNGGGIYNVNLTMSLGSFTGITHIDNSTVADNQAQNGGGVYSTGNLTITQSTISGNSAEFSGGGVQSAGFLNVSQSNFSGNIVEFEGSAIYLGSYGNITNTTFNSNVSNRNIGTITTDFGAEWGLYNVTIAGNTGGGLYGSSPAVMSNTIISNNGSNCGIDKPIDDGGNLQYPDDSCGVTIPVEDPQLGAPTGSPAYLPLLITSPAIDEGDPDTCETVDQRDLVRDADCDIGAFEFDGDSQQTGPYYAVNVATMENDGLCGLLHCSLIEAVEASVNYTGQGVVTLQADTTYTLTDVHNTTSGANGLPVISSQVVIRGNGATIQRDLAAPPFRLFYVSETGNLVMENLTLANGEETTTGGGAILNVGLLTMKNTTFANNQANNGGAIRNSLRTSLGTITIDASRLGNNTATNTGGAIASFGGDVTITRTTLAQNSSSRGGAYYAIATGGRIVASTFVNNTASNNDGMAIYTSRPFNLEITNSTLSGHDGTALFIADGGSIDLKHVTLANNNTAINGKGGTLNFFNTLLVDKAKSPVCATSVIPSGIIGQVEKSIATTVECGPKFIIVPSESIGLQPLLNTGGLTATHGLPENSQAVNNGDVAECATIDQRGIYRSDGLCDIGAYERVVFTQPEVGTSGGGLALVKPDGTSADFVRFGNANFDDPNGGDLTSGTVGLPLDDGRSIGRDPVGSDADSRIDWFIQPLTYGGPNVVRVVINEVFTGSVDAIEIYNPSIHFVDLSNWSLNIYNRNGVIEATYQFPEGYSIDPAEYVVIYEGTVPNGTDPTQNELYLGSELSWASSGAQGAVELVNGTSSVDFVRFGDSADGNDGVSTFAIDDVVPGYGTNWIEPSPLSPLPNQALGRDNRSTDTDRGADWIPQISTLGERNAVEADTLNDLFQNGIVIPYVPFRDTRSIQTASVQSNEPALPISCGTQIEHTVWYSYTPDDTGNTIFQTDGSDFNTILTIWQRNPDNTFSFVGCDNDSGEGNRSRLVIQTQIDTTYYIMIGSTLGSSGQLVFSVQPPVNDDIGIVMPISSTAPNNFVIDAFPYSDSQITTAASRAADDPTPTCGVLTGRSVWYRYDATSNNRIHLLTAGSNFDTVLAVYTGDRGKLTPVLCNNNTPSDSTSDLVFRPISGTSYYFMVAGNTGSGGNLIFQAEQIIPPPNDNYENAIDVGDLSAPFQYKQETFGATNQAFEPIPSVGNNPGKSVWFSYTAPTSAPVIFDTATSNYDTILSVWTGEPYNFVEVVSNDNTGIGTRSSRVTLNPVPGETYYIMISGYLGQVGTLNFNAYQPEPAPENDLRPSAIAIPELTPGGDAYTYEQDTSGATISAFEARPSCISKDASIFRNSVWFSYDVGSDEQYLHIQTVGSNYNTVLGVWVEQRDPSTGAVVVDTNTGLPLLQEVICNNDADGNTTSSLVMPSGTNTTLYIQVSSFLPGGGWLDFLINALPDPPVNDLLENAITIPDLSGDLNALASMEIAQSSSLIVDSQGRNIFSDSASSIRATTSLSDPNPNCALTVGETVWYEYTPTSDATLLLDTLGSDYDTVLSIWTEETINDETRLVQRACNDGETTSFIEFQPNLTVVSGTSVHTMPYYIMLAGDNGENGNFKLTVEERTPPVNDEYQNAILLPVTQTVENGITITVPATATQVTRGATTNPDDPIICNITTGRTVWYKYTVGASNGTLQLTTANSSFNTVLAVFTEETDGLKRVACQDNNGFGLTEVINDLKVSAYETYYIMVGGAFGKTGEVQLNWRFKEAPANDERTSPFIITGVTYDNTQDTSTATRNASDPTVCGFNVGHTVWYSYTPSFDSILLLTFKDSSYAPVIGVYNATEGRVTCGAGQDISFSASAGQTYLILVGSNDSRAGKLVIHADEVLVPANDDRTNAIVIDTIPVESEGVYSNTQDTHGASSNSDPRTSCATDFSIGKTVWYTYTATADDGLIRLRTSSSDFNTALAVFKVTESGASQVVCDSPGDVAFAAEDGATYYIMVGGVNNASGSLVLEADQIPRPANDDFDAAELITLLPVSSTVETRGASDPVGDPSSCQPGSGKSVWYRYDSEGNGTLDIVASGYETVVSVYSGIYQDLVLEACGTTSAEVLVEPLQSYYILVTDAQDVGGELTLAVDGTVVVPEPALSINLSSDVSAIDETAGDVNFTAVITNDSVLETISVTNVIDDTLGNVGTSCEVNLPSGTTTTAVPLTLEPGASTTCTFTDTLTGQAFESISNTVSTSAITLNSNNVIDSDSVTLNASATVVVDVTNVASSISVDHVANQESISSVGGIVGYTTTIENTSPVDDVTITTVQTIESVSGTAVSRILNDTCIPQVPITLVPGETITCNYDVNVTDVESGSIFVNTVVVDAIDDDQQSLTASDSAQILVQCDMTQFKDDLTVVFGEPYNSTTITNTSSNCIYDVGIASYSQTDGKTNKDLTLYDHASRILTPGSQATLDIELPVCDAWVIVFVGDVQTDSKQYGNTRLDHKFIKVKEDICSVDDSLNSLTVLEKPILSATADETGITLSWIHSNEIDTLYKVEKLNADGTWQTLATVADSTNTLLDTDLTCDTEYTYRVQASKDVTTSDYSETVSITTSACAVTIEEPAEEPSPTPTDEPVLVEIVPSQSAVIVGLYKEGVWRFRDGLDETGAEVTVNFGLIEAGWQPVVGDWNGNGIDDLGLYRDGQWILRDDTLVDTYVGFGSSDIAWQPVVGDWDGDGIDELGLYHNDTWQLMDGDVMTTITTSAALIDAQPIAVDWDGDGSDNLILYLNGQWTVIESLTNPIVVSTVGFGPATTGWTPLTGDWNDDGIETVGLFKDASWRLRDSLSDGHSDLGFSYGTATENWQPVTGFNTSLEQLTNLSNGADIMLPEAPVVSTPVTSTPVVETPISGSDVTETPDVETSISSSVVTETPQVTPPAVETPISGTPTTPQTDVSGTVIEEEPEMSTLPEEDMTGTEEVPVVEETPVIPEIPIVEPVIEETLTPEPDTVTDEVVAQSPLTIDDLPDQVTICHVAGNGKKFNVITISKNAVGTHLDHHLNPVEGHQGDFIIDEDHPESMCQPSG